MLNTGFLVNFFLLRTPEGLEDVSKYPNLFAALLEDKEVAWTTEDLSKLASGNLIRVFKEVERVRDSMKNDDPYQEWINSQKLSSIDKTCMSDNK